MKHTSLVLEKGSKTVYDAFISKESWETCESQSTQNLVTSQDQPMTLNVQIEAEATIPQLSSWKPMTIQKKNLKQSFENHTSRRRDVQNVFMSPPILLTLEDDHSTQTDNSENLNPHNADEVYKKNVTETSKANPAQDHQSLQ